MKKLAILTLLTTALFAATAWATNAAEPALKGDLQPRTDSPLSSGMPNASLTVRDCLSVLAGLSNMDARRVLVNKGKPNETVEVLNYQFKGAVRDSISHDIFLLGSLQQEAQAKDRAIRKEAIDLKPVVPGSPAEAKQRAEQDAYVADRVEEFASRPCKVDLDKIADADLKLDENDIPASVLAAIWKIRVK